MHRQQENLHRVINYNCLKCQKVRFVSFSKTIFFFFLLYLKANLTQSSKLLTKKYLHAFSVSMSEDKPDAGSIRVEFQRVGLSSKEGEKLTKDFLSITKQNAKQGN